MYRYVITLTIYVYQDKSSVFLHYLFVNTDPLSVEKRPLYPVGTDTDINILGKKGRRASLVEGQGRVGVIVSLESEQARKY